MRQPTPNPQMVKFKHARALQKAGKVKQAISEYRALILIAPKMAEAHFQLARLLIGELEYSKALNHLEVARKYAPLEKSVWRQTLHALNEANDLSRTQSVVKEVGSGPLDKASKAVLWIDLSQTLINLGDTKLAIKLCRDAQKVFPKQEQPTRMIARAHLHAGDFDKTAASCRSAIKINPGSTDAYLGLAKVHKFKIDDPELQDMKALLKTELTEVDTVTLNFALGKAHDDIKDYDTAFAHYKAANECCRKLSPFNFDEHKRVLSAMRSTLDNYDFEELAKAGKPDRLPIFITGSARSGTSLVEQILSRHPDVTSAGETEWFTRARTRSLQSKIMDDGDLSRDLSSAISALGETYLAQARERFPDAKYVTDKAIFNYRYLGPLAAALPNAPIIILRRDPRDTATSCYRNMFRYGTHLYSNDLADLGRHLVDFEKFVRYWSEKLPNRFLEVDYSELTKDPEPQAKRILDYCGLEWDPNVLTPGKSEYQVRTLSIVQARQPINSKSVASWKRYEKHLGPLFDALESD